MTIPKRYEITDELWARIEDLFPPYRTGRPAKLSHRQALNGVLWLLKSGAPWRDLPERYSPWKTVYSRFRLWTDVGLFEKMFKSLINDPDLENVSLDSTSIRVHKKQLVLKKRPVYRQKPSHRLKPWRPHD